MKALKAFLFALLGVVAVVAICGLLLIQRGFRATTAPSAWETALARIVRGFAVPASQRNEKNPIPATSDTLQQGREAFLTQCAARKIADC